MIILAIETSCDETAAAIVEFKKDRARVLANIVSSQIKTHSKFGGVVPSLAARMHLKNMVPVLRRAFKEAEKKSLTEFNSEASELNSVRDLIDYIAVTNGPGLIPALMIGVQTAKTLSYATGKPLIGVHHIEGHIYANWLTELKVHKVHKVESFDLWKPEFPVLCLIVSGGHTQLILMKKDLDYKIIGETVDDAAGEAFDKVAKLLELGYPGGPLIEKLAKKGDKNKFDFPRPMINSNDFNFSFSGLKTAVLYKVKSQQICSHSNFPSNRDKKNETSKLQITNYKLQINSKFKSDIAASFQQAVIDVLISKTIKAAQKHKVKSVILGGGVSANKELQKRFKKAINEELPNSKTCPQLDWGFQIPNFNLSTDNALMIAVAAHKHVLNNKNIKDWKSVKADANLKLK